MGLNVVMGLNVLMGFVTRIDLFFLSKGWEAIGEHSFVHGET